MSLVSKIASIGAAILIPNCIGFAGASITRSQIPTWYAGLKKPCWRPPNLVFPIAWTSLYTAMGYASYLIYESGNGFNGSARLPLILYALNLVANGLWTPLFFGKHRMDLAFVDIILMDALIAACVYTFHPVNETAAYLMIPYLCWTLFATALNYNIWTNNPKTSD